LPASNSLVREAKNPQMRGILATPTGTLTDIDTLLPFRKRLKGQYQHRINAAEHGQTALTAQPE